MIESEEIKRLLAHLDGIFAQDVLCNMLSVNADWEYSAPNSGLWRDEETYRKELDVYRSDVRLIFEGPDARIEIVFFNNAQHHTTYPKRFQISLLDPQCLEKAAQFVQSRGI